jgi:hypothetical protein
VLGPVERVAAMAGPHGVTHLLLSHVNGAASTVSVTLDSPPAGCLRGLVFFGEPGVATMPDGDLSAVDAFGGALTELVRDVRAGTTTHPCDVRYGRHVVAVLEAAQTALREERVVTVPS